MFYKDLENNLDKYLKDLNIFINSHKRELIKSLYEQEKKGYKKYGVTIENAVNKDWEKETLEEVADALVYFKKLKD